MLKIISGAQTGADRGALNAALAAQIPCGGWCPEDRHAEDGEIAPHYPVTPLVGAGYRKRTRQNVLDSDATVIVYHTEIALGSGTELTLKTCISQRKPYLLLDSSVLLPEIAGKHIAEFVQRHRTSVLNVGGSRGSVVPTIELFTEKAVLSAIQYLREM
ncbi:putative molybdenum carrier protein [Kingella negevensis]|uniref:putative molybdenum carrier protein n=1 Tax=Kingella TaxID=32257 RepID=UPI002543024B|nr:MULTISPECIES: putative molybdenum carrier protein [Kingella]MDK4545213.1 putative molybdenum carrier protein [Kingella kingae]MDK4685555.1 putative molybdenum carrier protein [Kingella negevensis]MDK4708727.1 putative molybdenum carrier protein [Kingella negevensis]MDK4710995.1 putative molybdenum carrier protein [Kingella negevensis]WII92822.1 putative molybdenum carrier protein [Kingella negevensis]